MPETPNDPSAAHADPLGRPCSGELSGVLTYDDLGHGRACGQIVGANGAGTYAVLIYGEPWAAADAAQEHVRQLEAAGHRLKNVTWVPAGDTYSRPAIQRIDAG